MTFDPAANLRDDHAFRLLSTSPVTLFWRAEVLADELAWLTERGYQVVRFDAGQWSAEADLHRDFVAALGFPDYYGHNLDALNDCLRDVVAHDYGWARDTTGLVLVLTGYDRFTDRCPDIAWIVLDILAGRSRDALLFGDRLLGLVQSDDPRLEFEPVGRTPVPWNDAEWLDSRRGI